MTTEDLGPMPEPEIEPGEPNPGGADALREDPESGGATPDPPLADNPAIAEKVPDAVLKEVGEGEDTSTRATRSDDGEDDEPEKESPA